MFDMHERDVGSQGFGFVRVYRFRGVLVTTTAGGGDVGDETDG